MFNFLRKIVLPRRRDLFSFNYSSSTVKFVSTDSTTHNSFPNPEYFENRPRFSEIVEEVKKMKFEPERYAFVLAVHALACMSRSSLEAKFDAYRKGLSKDEVQLMFRKHPYSLMLSEKNTMSTMNCFVNEMGYKPSLTVEHPNVTTYSLTRRISPRCSVIHILKIKGLVGDDCRLYSFLSLPEETFLKNYVIKFEKEVPEVLTAYQRNKR